MSTYKEALDLAGILLGEASVKSRKEPADAAELLKLADFVVSEICSEYFPLENEEEIDCSGEIPLAGFAKKVSEVISVERAGRKVKFRLKPFALSAPQGKLTVRYRYLPEPAAAESSELELSPRVSVKTAALGIASEYCLSKGYFEEAAAFDRRYRDSLAASSLRRGKVLPERSFL